jgi:hypothetical protein
VPKPILSPVRIVWPLSKLPKVLFESGVGKDLPDDQLFKCPVQAAADSRKKTLPTNKATIPCLHRTQTGRGKKKVITIADLNKAVKLTKKISSGRKTGNSGSSLPPNPVVTKLLVQVDELKQGGILPIAQSQSLTKTEAANSLKISRHQRKLQNKAKSDENIANYIKLYRETNGCDPKPKSVHTKTKDSETSGHDKVPNEELLDESDDESAPQGLTPMNLSADGDLSPVGHLSETVQQVVLNEDSGLRTAPDSKEVKARLVLL